MNDWKTSALDDCLERLIDYRGKSPPKSPTGIPVLSAKVVKTTGLITPIEQTIAPEYYSKWMTRGLPEVGDVILTTEGPLGEVIQLDRKSVTYALGQRIVCLRGKKGVLDNTFLRYLLTCPSQQEVLSSYATGTTVEGISQKSLRSVPISYPNFATQQQIGSALSALDDKIELNRRTNEGLEAIAQAIFRDWFVDFGPTRRKQAGVIDPVEIMGALISDPALAAKLAALFPDKLGDDLPVGWRSSDLSELATVNDESWKVNNHPDTVDYIDLSNTKWGVIESVAKLPWSEAPTRARRIVRPLDTIVATVRPGNGSYAFISEAGYTASTGFAVLRPRRTEYADALYIASTRPDAIQRLANLAEAHAGAYPSVNPHDVLATRFSASTPELLVAFGVCVRPMREKIEQTKRENQVLAETRDYLLPRLMSGAVRVNEAKLDEAI
jgi:type I restriction enzyme S subunit